jgi:hypothetical protein
MHALAAMAEPIPAAVVAVVEAITVQAVQVL